MRTALLTLGALLPLAAQDPASLERRLRDTIAASGAEVAVAYRTLDGRDEVLIDPDKPFHAASTMKVPVMIEYFRGIDAGRIRRNQELLLGTEFRSIVDGSPYSLDASVDSDSSVFARVGQRVPLRWLVERMIVRSSNLATNTLIEVLGPGKVDATARSLGASRTKVLRGVEDGKAFQQGLNNQTSARDLAALLVAIESGKAASKRSCREMIDILAAQEFNDEIPAGLPPGTRVAHKTGWITGVNHDAALVYPPGRKPYVLVVLTKGIPERPVAQRLIADISRLVWDAVTARS